MKKIKVSKIESSVPIPVKRVNPVPIRELEVGDSIKFPIELCANVQSFASRMKAKEDREFTISKINDNECRIWRIR